MTVTLEAEGAERTRSRIRALLDPTTGLPEFAFVAVGDRPEVTDWHLGAWDGDATDAGGRWTAYAVSPTIGGTDSAATVKLEPGSWVPWVRFTVADETVVRPLKRLRLRGPEG